MNSPECSVLETEEQTNECGNRVCTGKCLTYDHRINHDLHLPLMYRLKLRLWNSHLKACQHGTSRDYRLTISCYHIFIQSTKMMVLEETYN